MKCPVCNSSRMKNGRCQRCKYINDKSKILEDFYTFERGHNGK